MEEIFLCARYTQPPPKILSGCPTPSLHYQARESRAAGQTVQAIRAKAFELPCPWTGRLVTSPIALTFAWQDHMNALSFIPLVYGFGARDLEFWVATCGLTGRIVHLYFPALDVAVYELSLSRAQIIDAEFRASLSDLRKRRSSHGDAPASRVIGVLDMVTNYGHQVINHLSGVEQLIKAGCDAEVDEYWISGNEFFGSLEDLYPELRNKVRYFAERRILAQQLLAATRIGRPHRLELLPEGDATTHPRCRRPKILPPEVPSYFSAHRGNDQDIRTRLPESATVDRTDLRRLSPQYPGSASSSMVGCFPNWTSSTIRMRRPVWTGNSSCG